MEISQLYSSFGREWSGRNMKQTADEDSVLNSKPLDTFDLIVRSNIYHSPPSLRIQLDVISWEQARLSTMMTEPPVLIREFQVRNSGTLGKAQFCNLVSNLDRYFQ